MASTLIKIIKGTYGYWDGMKVVPKTAKDEPFPVETGRAKELVDAGIAKLADEQEDDGEDENLQEVDDETIEDVIDEAEEDEAVNLDELTLDELKKFAEPYGVKYKVGMKKAEFIEAIRAAEMEADEQEDDGEDAPTFNAEDAVQ